MIQARKRRAVVCLKNMAKLFLDELLTAILIPKDGKKIITNYSEKDSCSESLEGRGTRSPGGGPSLLGHLSRSPTACSSSCSFPSLHLPAVARILSPQPPGSWPSAPTHSTPAQPACFCQAPVQPCSSERPSLGLFLAFSWALSPLNPSLSPS